MVEILQIITATSILFVWVVRYENIITEFKQYQLPVWLRDMVGILMIQTQLLFFSWEFLFL